MKYKPKKKIKDTSKNRSCIDRHKQKKRHSIYKTEKNLYWEKVYKLLVDQLCIDHNIDYNNFASNGKKTTFWRDICHILYNEGFRNISLSIAMAMHEIDNQIVSPDEYCYT